MAEAKPPEKPKEEAKKEEAKPAAQPVAKPEAQPAAKPAAQPGAKPEAQPAARPEAKKEAKPKKKSGLYYPNVMGRIMLSALEEVMGKNGLNAILNLAGLSQLIDNYPPGNLERQFDFADLSALCTAVEDMYGPRGGRGLLLRAGRALFARGLKDFGAFAGVGDLAFRALPLVARLRIGVPAMAKVFSGVSDQKSTVEEKEDHFRYTIHQCSMCWGRKADAPVCHIGAGLLQEGLKWVSSGREFRVAEIECKAKGDENCVYIIQKEPIG